MADLADIDQYEKTPGLEARMNILVEQLTHDELNVLGQACGFGQEKRRQWGAIAKWLNSLGYDHPPIKSDNVSRWARGG